MTSTTVGGPDRPWLSRGPAFGPRAVAPRRRRALPAQPVAAAAEVPRAQRAVLLVVLSGVPVTFIATNIAGFGIAGWVWITELLLLTPLLITTKIVRHSGRFIVPYLIFVEIGFVSLLWTPSIASGVQTGLQFMVPPIAYLLAWRLPADVRDVTRRGTTIALAIAIAMIGGTIVGVVPGSIVSVRPMAISLLLLYVVFSASTDSTRQALMVGLVLAALETATGSRTAALVMVGLLATNRRLRISPRGRTALLVGLLAAVVAVTQTQAFRQRVFYDPDTTVQAFLAGKAPEQLNTSGRLDYWPKIYSYCKGETWRGEGLGASYSIAQNASDGALTQPHQELLRTFCDTGLPGAGIFWIGFVGWAVARSFRRSRRHPDDVWHSAALQGTLAFFAVAMTDNPLVYTGHFMALLFVVLGLSDRCREDGVVSLPHLASPAQSAAGQV